MGAFRPRHDIADIVRQHRAELEQVTTLSRAQKRVLTDIAQCRTAALGGHLDYCPNCGWEHPVYNSCRNRHCPKCQALAGERWITSRTERILPIGHFHLVLALPSEMRQLAQLHPVEIYRAFFHSVKELLLELGQTRLKATLGLTMVLHTWTRELTFHTHLHVLVTAGGLSLDRNRFVHIRKKYLFPGKVMGILLRGKMLDALRDLQAKGTFPELDPLDFHSLMTRLARHKVWHTHAEAPFRRSHHVIAYLSRYTHRVGIANSRLVDVSDRHVTFRTRGEQRITLPPVEFLRRFVQHVLPNGFHKIRHAGLYASAQPGGLLERAKALLPARSTRKAPAFTPEEAPTHCPRCGEPLLRFPLIPEWARAPPLTAS